MSEETRTGFYVELPADEDGNTSLPKAVVRCRVETYRGVPSRDFMVPLSGKHAREFPGGWLRDSHGGWAETEGPARELTRVEWFALVASLGHPVQEG